MKLFLLFISYTPRRLHSIDMRIAYLAFEYQHKTGFLLSESVFSFSFDGNNEIQDHKIADIVARGRF